MSSPKEGGDFPNKKEFKAKIIFFSPRHWDTPHQGGHQGDEVRNAERH